MESLVGALAGLVLVAAFVTGGLVLLATGAVHPALAVFLDLLTAAGLLRLGAADTWGGIVTAAAVVGIRKLAVAGLRNPALRAGASAETAAPPARGS